MRLLQRLFGTRRPAALPSVPGGYRLYAVGDVHGREDLLVDLLGKIEADQKMRGPAKCVLVFLGDLIDRGPYSAQVVERLRTLSIQSSRLVFLAGNHEEVLLRIVGGNAGLLTDWLKFGGAECLRSYGADPDQIRRLSPRKAVEAVRSAIPFEHVEFLQSFDDTFRAGDFLFVHAGIRPGLPLTEQAPSDLRWIREPFLSDPSDHGFVIVHGHTIRQQVEERINRIGIDTGAYRFGVLTALGLEGTSRWFLQSDGISRFVQDVRNEPNSSVLDMVSGQSG